jgi:hypothetical protein
MSSLLVTSQMSLTLESLEASAMFFKRGQNLLNLLLKFMEGSCSATTQIHTYRVLNKDYGCVETTCDVVFDVTNDFHVEQHDPDVVDDEEAPCDTSQRMVIGYVRPQDLGEPQPNQSPNDTTSPTQDHEQDQEDEQDEDQVYDQEKNIDQGVDEDDGDLEGSRTRPPHPRVRQTVQRDHPVEKFLVISTFCQHYSFVSFLEPFKVEDALRDPDWVVVMQEELNNFKRNGR